MSIVDFFQILSSIATTAALILALWQSGYSNQKRIKAVCWRLHNSEYVYKEGKKNKERTNLTFRIDITNIGRYDVCIKKIVLQRKKKMYWNLNYFASEIKVDDINFPIVLKVGDYDKIHVFVDKREIGDIQKGDRILLYDSANKRYKCKLINNPV